MGKHALPRVLLVDDHEGVLYAWRRLLAPSCVVVGLARTGEEALAAAAESNPDVVVIDQLLPDSNGIDLCSRILAIAPQSRVVVVSALDDDETVAAARRAGASAFVAKTGAPTELEAAIDGAFAGRMKWPG